MLFEERVERSENSSQLIIINDNKSLILNGNKLNNPVLDLGTHTTYFYSSI